MKSIHEETEIKLNELIERSIDAEKGFIKASEYVDNPKLKSYFSEKVIETNGYISELRHVLLLHGIDVEDDDDGSVSGTLHRVWIDTKALFSLDSDQSIVEEVKEGEKETIKDYEEILSDHELNQEIRVVLLKQKNAIEMSSKRLDILENI